MNMMRSWFAGDSVGDGEVKHMIIINAEVSEQMIHVGKLADKNYQPFVAVRGVYMSLEYEQPNQYMDMIFESQIPVEFRQVIRIPLEKQFLEALTAFRSIYFVVIDIPDIAEWNKFADHEYEEDLYDILLKYKHFNVTIKNTGVFEDFIQNVIEEINA